MVTGSTVQEDIVATTRQLLLRGRNILGCVSPETTRNTNPTPCHDPQTSAATRAAASHSPCFSWVDHRLVRDHYVPRADHSAWALYLFLFTVADVQGLGFYSDHTIGRHLKMDALQLSAARQQFVQADLIAYQRPLYQVLALPEDSQAPASTPPRSGQVQSVGQILRRVLEGGQT